MKSKLTASNCPSCTHSLDGALSVGIERAPRAGDMSICSYCGCFVIFTENLGIREPTANEWLALSNPHRIELIRTQKRIVAERKSFETMTLLALDAGPSRIPDQRCPSCDEKLDAVTPIKHREAPKEGDTSICARCGAFLVCNKDLTQRQPNVFEILAWPEEVRQLMTRGQRLIRTVVAKRGTQRDKKARNPVAPREDVIRLGYRPAETGGDGK